MATALQKQVGYVVGCLLSIAEAAVEPRPQTGTAGWLTMSGGANCQVWVLVAQAMWHVQGSRSGGWSAVLWAILHRQHAPGSLHACLTGTDRHG